MFVTTHTVVATTIAVKTGNPYIYIPAAFLNHLVLDAFPHYGNKVLRNRSFFKIAAFADAIFGFGFFLFFILKLDLPIINLLIIDLMAGWPDLLLFYNKIIDEKKFVLFQKWHSQIQKYEFRGGVFIEIALIGVCLFLLLGGAL